MAKKMNQKNANKHLVDDIKMGELIKSFNLTSSIVKLKRIDECVFRVSLSFDDPYLNAATYNDGTGFIHLSDLFYQTIEKMGIDRIGYAPQWNNDKSIGWFLK